MWPISLAEGSSEPSQGSWTYLGPQVCKKYAKRMQNVCKKYAKSMQKLCKKYAKIMQKGCKKYLLDKKSTTSSQKSFARVQSIWCIILGHAEGAGPGPNVLLNRPL